MTTPTISWPASRTASIACSVEPPVVTTSSTTRQRSSGLERRTLDAALQAVLLGLLAHEEGLDVGAAGQRGAGGRVGAHRQAADRGRRRHSRARAATSSASAAKPAGRRIARLAST